MKTLGRKRLYVPAITLVMIIVTLVVMHAISTFRTLDREWSHWEGFLERNAHDVISTALIALAPDLDARVGDFETVMERIVQNPDIAYFGILDDKGRWIFKSRLPSLRQLPEEGERGWIKGHEKTSYRKTGTLQDGHQIFQYRKDLPLLGFRSVQVALWMTPLEEARKHDISHALMMAAILLVLGSAAIYFIFVIQNYYLVDRTLSEMRSYTENVVESMASGLLTVDTNGRIVSTNRSATRMLGQDAVHLSGQSLKDLLPAEQLDIDSVIRHDKTVTDTEIDYAGDGHAIPLSAGATPLKGSEGTTIGAVILLQDLREIRELQEKVRRSERLASLGRFASGVAHEIRNPLSSIKGFGQYFAEKFESGSEDRSYADIIIREADRLDRVITELLDFARPRELNLHPLTVTAVLNHPLQLIEPDLKKKGISLVRSDGAAGTVAADSDQITQAFLNVLLNAMESMDKGGELRVTTASRPETGWVEIAISDTGHGISKENLGRIFDPLFSTKKKGTGLGLAITAKIIEAHGGEIKAESEEGKGTVFLIRLPLANKITEREDSDKSQDIGS